MARRHILMIALGLLAFLIVVMLRLNIPTTTNVPLSLPEPVTSKPDTLDGSRGLEVAAPASEVTVATPEPTTAEPSARVVLEEPPAVKLSRMRDRMEAQAAEHHWNELYSSKKPNELATEKARLESVIADVAKEAMESRFASGQFTNISEQEATTISEQHNPFEISWVRFIPGEQPRKCTLPEAGFESVYDMRLLSVWLDEQVMARSNRTATVPR